MNITNENKTNRTQTAPQGLNHNSAKRKRTPFWRRLKLGIDVHLRQYTVVAQYGEQAPRPARVFTPEEFLAWVAQQIAEGWEVHSCYEAGAFGYNLHRRLTALGAHNLVVRPRNWDEYGSGRKTDRRDALLLCGMLDRHLAGNSEALCIVRVPGEAEEQARAQTRQRDSLVCDRSRLANRGKSAARYFGCELPANWWRPRAFKALEAELPAHLIAQLSKWQAVLLELDKQIADCSAQIETHAPEKLPTGLGALTAEGLEREVCDWKRFNNRRQVGSYTGLIPGEHSSGDGRHQGSITKHGNPRMRHMLVEASWRLTRFQPNYRAVKQHREAMAQAKAKGQSARRRKLIVAIARTFAVDWWRVRTGRVTPEKLGLQMSRPTLANLPVSAKPPVSAKTALGAKPPVNAKTAAAST
jgi:transposase